MSICPKSDLISTYLDGEIPSPWKERLELHISNCKDCKSKLLQYQNIKNLVKESQPIVSEEFLESSFQRLNLKFKTKELISQQSNNNENVFTKIYKARVKMPIAAIAAIVVFALFIPPIFYSKKQDNFAPSMSNYESMITKALQLQKLSTDNAIYSPDLPSLSIRKSIINENSERVFNLMQLIPDHKEIINSEIVIIRLPNIQDLNYLETNNYNGVKIQDVGFSQ